MATKSETKSADIKAKLISGGVSEERAAEKAGKWASYDDADIPALIAMETKAARDAKVTEAAKRAEAAKSAIQPLMEGIGKLLTPATVKALEAFAPYTITIGKGADGKLIATVAEKRDGRADKRETVAMDGIIGETMTMTVKGFTFKAKVVSGDELEMVSARGPKNETIAISSITDDKGNAVKRDTASYLGRACEKVATGTWRRSLNGKAAWGVNAALEAKGLLTPAAPAAGNGAPAAETPAPAAPAAAETPAAGRKGGRKAGAAK